MIISAVQLDKKTRTKKIWIYKDRSTGIGKGECTITYDDPQGGWMFTNIIIINYLAVAHCLRSTFGLV